MVETVENWSAESSVIGALEGIDKVTSIFKLTYNSTGGNRNVNNSNAERIHIAREITAVPTSRPPSSIREQVGLITPGESGFEIEHGEPLEIKAK